MARYRDGILGGTEKYDFSATSVARGLLLICIPVMAYTLGALPIIFSLVYVMSVIDLTSFAHVCLFTFILVWEFLLFIICETFVPGIFIRLLRLQLTPGEYDITIKDTVFFRYILYFALYRPSLKLIGILPLLPLRTRFLKLVGLKMGKSSVVTGSELIQDPTVIEIGEHTIIGGFSMILGHVGEKKLVIKPVKIGNNCLIGGRSIIMPGAIIEDDVILGLNSLVLKDQILKKGRTYGGTPAVEIKTEE
jgi:acetyltransferase-like isoleucine patch superfamily enzyme